MGLLGKLKNATTGGAAKVELETETFADTGCEMAVTVTVTSTGSEVKSDGVFVDIEADEVVRFRDETVADKSRADRVISTPTVREAIRIAEPLVLGAGETRQWKANVPIPSGKPPTSRGAKVTNEWRVRGRLEAFGNDPDSGFRPLHVMATEYGRPKS